MENKMFEQAKQAVQQFMNGENTNMSEKDKQAAQQAIQSAYTNATAEEQKQLQKFENQLGQHNQLK